MNQDQERFLIETYREGDSVRAETVKAFSSLEPWERMWNTDFTEQPLEVLQQALNESVFSSRTNFAIRTLSLLTRYATWRRKDGLPCTDAIWHAVPDTSFRMRRTMLASPRHLRRVLDTAFDPPESCSGDVVIRTFLWLGFMGAGNDEVMDVDSNQVSIRTLAVRLPGKTLHIPAEAVNDFAFCIDTVSFRVPRSVYGKSTTVEKERATGTALLRGIKDSVFGFKKLQGVVYTRLKSARASSGDDAPGLSTSFDFAQLSGLFWDVFEDERIGIAPDFGAIARKVFDRRQSGAMPYTVTQHFTPASLTGRMARSLEADYNSWKRAFNA